MTSPDQVDDNDSSVIKRSISISGHRTSVSLENAFWKELQKIAQRRGKPLNSLVTGIDKKRRGNLSSALRLFVLEELKKGAPDQRSAL